MSSLQRWNNHFTYRCWHFLFMANLWGQQKHPGWKFFLKNVKIIYFTILFMILLFNNRLSFKDVIILRKTFCCITQSNINLRGNNLNICNKLFEFNFWYSEKKSGLSSLKETTQNSFILFLFTFNLLFSYCILFIQVKNYVKIVRLIL